MSTLDEVDEAVKTIKNANSNCKYSILHCNSSYPAPIEDLNLKCINTLQKRYQCKAGSICGLVGMNGEIGRAHV